MGLLSIFQRKEQAAAKPGRGGKAAARQAPPANTQSSADAADAVRDARARARRRLMGATVLLLVGIIGFPLLFETQPRPIPVDLPIEIPARNAAGGVDGAAAPHGNRSVASLVSAAPPPLPAASGPVPESVSYDAPSSAAQAASVPASAPAAAKRSAFASLAAALTPSGAGSAAASAVPASAARVASAAGEGAHARPATAASKPAPHVAAMPAPAAASHPASAAPFADATPARPASAAPAGRFVVQVGAFTEEAKLREARSKVEKIGLKTYTQQVDTPAGRRVRVRVGPFSTKAEADKAAARIRAIGLQPGVLTL